MKEIISPESFQWKIQESHRSIARRIGADKETVRRRIKQIEGLGIIKGWHLVPNPAIFERKASAIVIDVSDESRKPEIISQLEFIDGIVMIMDFEGKQLQLQLFYEDDQELSRKTQLIKLLCGSQDAITIGLWFPPIRRTLTETDWNIVRKLSKEPKQRLSDIAVAIKVSSRTVKRRLTAMIDAKTFYMVPQLNYKKIAGLSCRFVVCYSDSKHKMKNDELISEKLRGQIIFSFTGGNDASGYNVLCANLAVADETQKWFHSLSGIKHVKAGIFRDMILPTEWISKEIDRRISISK
jgi:DNA-binding Lrp family transcriptional regulator